jgi:hypothetical protein
MGSPIYKIRNLLHLSKIDRTSINNLSDLKFKEHGYFKIRAQIPSRIFPIIIGSKLLNDSENIFIHRQTQMKVSIYIEKSTLILCFWEDLFVLGKPTYDHAGIDLFNYLIDSVKEWGNEDNKESAMSMISKALHLYIQRAK